MRGRTNQTFKARTILRFFIIFCISFSPVGRSFCQIIKDESERFDIIGIRPTLKHINLFYQHAVSPNTSVYIDAGYEFRYIKQYQRFTALQLGFLPSLASQGVLGEAGFIFHLDNTDLMLGCQYKFSHIRQGEDYYLTVSDGSFEDVYTRDDHKITVKLNWIFNPQQRVQYYLGCGVRVARAYHWNVGEPRNYSDRNTWTKQWIIPTVHLGIRIAALRKPHDF